ncbi:MAG: fatty acid desaturase [Novosphingobium sp.]
MSASQLELPADIQPRSTPVTEPSRSELHKRIAPFARASSVKGYLSFAIDIAIYSLGIAAVLFVDNLLGKVAGGVLAGSGLVNLGSLSHEAAHRAVVKSRLGNKIIAVASMTIILFNYRLWIYEHHVLHHARTNVKDHNFLSPLSLAEYRELSGFQRALYRAYHSETGLGILLYYLLKRWPDVHFYPGAWLPKRFHASAWRYTALEALFAVALLSVLVSVAAARQDSIVLAVVLGFVVPYAAWFMTFAMTAFLQHTNPRLRWYKNAASVASRPELLSVQVLIPGWLNHLTHYVLEHPVHHVSAMVPHYYLKQAQAALAGFAGPPIIAMRFTFGNMSDVLRRCKLYDYDEHVWVNFAGEVTGIPDDTLRLRQSSSASDDLAPYGPTDTSAGVFFPSDPGAAAPQPTGKVPHGADS